MYAKAFVIWYNVPVILVAMGRREIIWGQSVELLNILFAIVSMIFTAGGIYTAIKSDLKSAIQSALEAKLSAQRAHERIDTHLEKGHLNG